MGLFNVVIGQRVSEEHCRHGEPLSARRDSRIILVHVSVLAETLNILFSPFDMSLVAIQS